MKKTTERGTTILDKIFGTKYRNTVKTGQDEKILISTFACFLTAMSEDSSLEGGMGGRLCLHPYLRFSKYFLIS